MLVEFDGPNRLILPVDPTGVLNVKFVYSEWKRWASQLTYSKFYQALSTVGGDPITSDDDIPTYYYLMNGWRVKWPDGNISVEIQGNLLVYGGLDTPYLPIDGQYSYNVTSIVATQDAMSEEAFHNFLDTYINKDAYKADVSDLSVDANIVEVSGIAVAGVDDFKASEVDMSVTNAKIDAVGTTVGSLSNYNDTNIVAQLDVIKLLVDGLTDGMTIHDDNMAIAKQDILVRIGKVEADILLHEV